MREQVKEAQQKRLSKPLLDTVGVDGNKEQIISAHNQECTERTKSRKDVLINPIYPQYSNSV